MPGAAFFVFEPIAFSEIQVAVQDHPMFYDDRMDYLGLDLLVCDPFGALLIFFGEKLGRFC